MKTFDLNFFQLLILLGSIQGLIFAFIIFLQKKFRIKSNIFLGLMVVFIALSNVQHILIDMDFFTEVSVIRKLYLPVQWLVMPMFYLHVNQTVRKQNPKLPMLLTLLLPVVIVTFLHTINFFHYQQKISITALPDYYEKGLLLYTNLGSFVFNTVLIYMTYRLLNQNTGSAKNSSRKQIETQKWYIKIILFFVVITSIGLCITIALIQFSIDHTWLVYSILLLVSFVGYYMGYMGVYRSTLRDNRKNQNNALISNGSNTFKKITAYILEKQLYLNMGLSLSEIAEKFNISPGYLSQLMNTHAEEHFSDYINKLRIDTSKKMLIENQFENYTIESIGLECGFKSKSNFYTAFKKFTGQTPTAYIKSQEMRPVS